MRMSESRKGQVMINVDRAEEEARSEHPDWL